MLGPNAPLTADDSAGEALPAAASSRAGSPDAPSPLVSIIIDNYNYARYLPDAIDSALGQTYRPIEVIVVDDGSSDGSREIIIAYGDRLLPVFKANGGQASAFNAGLASCQGEIVIFL